MPPTLYDMFWQYPLQGEQAKNWMQINKVNLLKQAGAGIPAVILYPALLTPEIVVGDNWVELLVVVKKEDELKVQDVNSHLKVSEGVNPRREFYETDLVAQNQAQVIKVKSLGDLAAEKPFKTQVPNNGGFADGLFSGMVDKRAVKLYKNKGFKKVYAVAIKFKSIKDSVTANKNKPCKRWNDSTVFNAPYYDDDNQDNIVYEAVNNGDASKRYGRMGYKVQGDDVQAGELDDENPVQAYHPVFYFKDLKYASIGHMADIHLSSRQQLLAKSKARVIEEAPAQPADPMVGKTVGEMVNICSKNTKFLLDEFGGGGNNVDLVAISGDIVDFNKNICEGNTIDHTVREIWGIVGLEKKKYKQHYKENVDFISLYSLLIDFYKNRARPVYAVTGNHDCYAEPFGIYPQIKEFFNTKTNYGIPNDHNLTVYEATLCFGPTYYVLFKTIRKNFVSAKFAWFYTVYTPFSDFAVELPEQILVGLAWGNAESMFIRPGYLSDQPKIGHLPTSDDAVSDKQWTFITDTVKKNKKVILCSHFTFASYVEGMTEKMAEDTQWGSDPKADKTKQGRIYLESSSLADMGTFHRNRPLLYKEILKGNKIQCVLTGHSHRRGLYTIRNLTQTAKGRFDYVKSDFCAFHPAGQVGDWRLKRQKGTYIIVSDSGGSVPRRNKWGEFKGEGSDKPSGTKITFHNNGDVRDVMAVQVDIKNNTGGKPRFVVGLDYFDLFGHNVIKKFESRPVYAIFDTYTSQRDGYEYSFKLELSDRLNDYKLTVEEIVLYCFVSKKDGWEKIEFHFDNAPHWEGYPWIVKNAQSPLLYNLPSNKKRGVFLAMKFKSTKTELNDIYEFDTPWTFEAYVERNKKHTVSWKSKRVYYDIQRYKRKVKYDPCQFPDFKRRRDFGIQYR